MKKTIERRGKTSSQSFFQKDEILSTKINLQTTSKRTSFGETKSKTETRTIKKISADSSLRSCFGDGFGNPIPKNSERVEEFIKQIPNYVEIKDSNKRTQKNEVSAKNASYTKFKISDKDIEMNLGNIKWKNPSLLQCIPKKQKRSSQSKKNKLSNGNKRDQSEKKHKKELLPTTKTDFNRNKTQSEDFHLSVEKKKQHIAAFSSQETITKEQSGKQAQLKKRKPSEIPLRKSRIEASRKSKPVSTFLQKSLEEIDSTNSFDYFMKKPCSPIEEVSLGSELQITVNAVCSCDDISDNDKTAPKTPRPQELHNNIRLERCSKNFDIPTATSSMSEDLSEEKTRILTFLTEDLNKVKTSSFTIIQTSPTVFDRLESLHKQNVLAKEKINAVASKKSRPLTPKQSYHSVKVKSIRKSSRSPSKRNKSNLRIKAKKSKKKIGEDFPHLEKSSTNVKEPHIVILKKILEADGFKTDSCESAINENRNNTPKKSSKDGEKSTKKQRNSREKEEIRPTTSYGRSNSKTAVQDVENAEKEKVMMNRVACKNKPNSAHLKLRNNLVPPKSSSEKSRKHIKSKKREEKASKTSLSKNDKSTETCGYEIEKTTNPTDTKNDTESLENLSNEDDVIEIKSSSLIIRGRALKFEKEVEEEKEKEEVTSTKGKKQLKINLNLQDASEENVKNNQLRASSGKKDINETRTPTDEEKTEKKNIWPGVRDEKSQSAGNNFKTDLNSKEDGKSSSVVTGKGQNKVSNQKPKGIRKKPRSDAGDRPPSFGPFYTPNMSPKSETKPRNGLTKPHKDDKEIFEEVPLKLKRSNSEPNSFNGYIWKRTDFPIFKGHKPSVSSMASSLKHLNTDDIDDFSFWEPVPQKVTFGWEMSLYHFQKPWTVLSRSIFRDNRLSNTPGLILQNLRNGGKLNIGPSPRSEKGRVNCVKENPFDVEPSIAQKNIDIRNWLAALNFPTSSTPTNVISEGISTSDALVDPQNINKIQVNPKRRKIFRNMKFPDENITKEKNQYNNWKINEMEGLKDLVRRKSGGFVISEERVDIKHLQNQSKDGFLSSLASTPTERANNRRNIVSKPELNESQERFQTSSATVSYMPFPPSHNSVQITEYPQEVTKKLNSQSKSSSKNLPLQFNIWKYLFILTIFIIIIHYYYYYYHSEISAY